MDYRRKIQQLYEERAAEDWRRRRSRKLEVAKILSNSSTLGWGMQKYYRYMKTLVTTSVGFSEKDFSVIKIPNELITLGNIDFFANGVVRDAVKECFGVDVLSGKDIGLKFFLNGDLKVGTLGVCPDDVFDFPWLYEENSRRRREWVEFGVKKLATEIVNTVKTYLMNWDYKIYGMPTWWKIEPGVLPETFQFLDGEIAYTQLNRSQRQELEGEVNKQISRGHLYLGIGKYGEFVMTLERRPDNTLLTGLFDYEGFCAAYDDKGMSVEVQELMRHIIDNLYVPAEEQVAKLSAERVMCYKFTDDSPVSYELFAGLGMFERYYEVFCEMFEEEYDGLLVQNWRLVDDALRLSYGVREPNCENEVLPKTQIDAEQTIDFLLGDGFDFIATDLINRILKVASSKKLHIVAKKQEWIFDPEADLRITVDLGKYDESLKGRKVYVKLLNDEMKQRLCRRIMELTDGVIRLSTPDDRTFSYTLHFDQHERQT